MAYHVRDVVQGKPNQDQGRTAAVGAVQDNAV